MKIVITRPESDASFSEAGVGTIKSNAENENGDFGGSGAKNGGGDDSTENGTHFACTNSGSNCRREECQINVEVT